MGGCDKCAQGMGSALVGDVVGVPDERGWLGGTASCSAEMEWEDVMRLLGDEDGERLVADAITQGCGRS